jgi:hypothetical protein
MAPWRCDNQILQYLVLDSTAFTDLNRDTVGDIFLPSAFRKLRLLVQILGRAVM